jgi:hypothetical protein
MQYHVRLHHQSVFLCWEDDQLRSLPVNGGEHCVSTYSRNKQPHFLTDGNIVHRALCPVSWLVDLNGRTDSIPNFSPMTLSVVVSRILFTVISDQCCRPAEKNYSCNHCHVGHVWGIDLTRFLGQGFGNNNSYISRTWFHMCESVYLRLHSLHFGCRWQHLQ